MPESHVLQEYRALETRVLDAMIPTLGDDDFSRLALDVFEFQCRWNPVYRAFAAARPQPNHWREIPAVPQAAFKRAVLSCVPANEAGSRFRTSGTTGESRGEHHFANLDLYDASIVRGWDRLELPRLPLWILARKGADAADSSLSHMFDLLARERGRNDARWFLHPDGSLDLEAFGGFAPPEEPVAFLGTALGFLNLFERMGSARIALPPGSFALETGGYKGSGRMLAKRDLYEMFERYLGLP